MDSVSGLKAYDFALVALKQSADRQGQTLKTLLEDGTAGPSNKGAPTNRTPAAPIGARGQKVDIIV